MKVQEEKNMKKLIFVFTAFVALTLAAGAQEFKISGLVKTGFFWEETQREGKDAERKVRVHNNDDAGDQKGRFRLDMQYDLENIGIKTRVQWDDFANRYPNWNYAYGYSRFLDDQIVISLGLLGDSPWGSAGPELWKELETSMGVRTEIKPKVVPGLNMGFVLNDFNHGGDSGYDAEDCTFVEILKESVFAVRYDHDYFAGRFAYRLDSVIDHNSSYGPGHDGDELLYRLEERVIQKHLEGFQIWINGEYKGINTDIDDIKEFKNWLYFQYAPEKFTAQLRVGFDMVYNRSILHIKPNFYYHFFDGFLTAGTAFTFAQDFAGQEDFKMYAGSPYLYWEIEPKIEVRIGNFITTLAYSYRDEYAYHVDPPKEKKQWLNLRFVFNY
jgi:hypothetical protein